MSFTKATGVVVPSISNRITVISAGTESTTISPPAATTRIGLLVGRAEPAAPSNLLGCRQPRKESRSAQPRAARCTRRRGHVGAPENRETRSTGTLNSQAARGSDSFLFKGRIRPFCQIPQIVLNNLKDRSVQDH